LIQPLASTRHRHRATSSAVIPSTVLMRGSAIASAEPSQRRLGEALLRVSFLWAL
jgi:hypothetical protein